MLKYKLTVMDFFCGAGGFSEGFRQQGFKVVRGIDFWQPAIDTHNLNHHLDDSIKNVLEFWNKNSTDVKEIEKLEDTEFIIGSPSCISFSMSNKAGKADKSHGLKLIEAYLRVIVVKKHKPNSILKGWYMENVPKSRDYIRDSYTFNQLNLANWAEKNGYKKTDIALKVQGEILNAGDYGSPQERKRFIAGEWIETGEFIFPKITHAKHKTVKKIRGRMPRINTSKNKKTLLTDPNYQNLSLPIKELTDHFYDTGVYNIWWEKAEFLKTNHPFMGKMSFPENEERTSRTILATRSSSSRETLLYKSEYKRKGDGEYRLPTIREVASLMGYPYVYQFIGSEGIKWKQIGNSVCPHQSAALAKALRVKMGLEIIPDNKINFSFQREHYKEVNNLNTFKEKSFDSPGKRKTNAKFRRHAIKLGNITVDLMNFHPEKKDNHHKWYVTAFFGTGDGYGIKIFKPEETLLLEQMLINEFPYFENYKKRLKTKIPEYSDTLQDIYEKDLQLKHRQNPVIMLKEIGKLISSYKCHKQLVRTNNLFPKNEVPLAQLMSAYSLLTINHSLKRRDVR